MNNEEARNLLNNSKLKDNNAYSIMLNEALDMAIKALEQEPKTEWISVSERLPTKKEYKEMNIYVDDGEAVKSYTVTPKIAEAVMTLLEADDGLIWSMTNAGYGVTIVNKKENGILDKIRAEIDSARFINKDTKLCKNANASGLEVTMQIIDKYKAESEVQDANSN